MKTHRLFLPVIAFVALLQIPSATAGPMEDVIFLQSNHTGPQPTITSLSPASAAAGGLSFSLTVNGTNYVTGATVRWNGSPRNTTFGSATRLTAAIPSSDLSTPGAASVTVALPNGAVSNAATFNVTSDTTLIFAQIADGQ